MGEWKPARLRDLGVSLIDCVHKTPEAQPAGYPYVGIPQMKNGRIDFSTARLISQEDYLEWTKKAKPQKYDVILSRRTNPGVIAIDDTGTEFALGQNLVLLRADGIQVYPPFLKWMTLSPYWWEQIAKFNNVGAVFDSLKCADVPNFELPVPPRDIQKSIAELLGALDDKIELNRRMSQTLEATARAIFKDWFVDFGPTRAKIEGRAPYLPADIWSLFPDSLDNEGKPDGWKREPLGEHMVNFDSKRVPVSGGERAKRQGPFPYHGATGVMDYVDDYLYDGIFLLVGEDGSVVKKNGLAFTQYVWGKLWVNNHAHVLQGKGAVSTEHLLMHFQHELVTPYITGAVQLKLSQGRMNAMPFIFPGTKVCEAFTRFVTPFFTKFRANTDENKSLAEMRDLLLPKLMSGEVQVKETNKIAGEAL